MTKTESACIFSRRTRTTQQLAGSRCRQWFRSLGKFPANDEVVLDFSTWKQGALAAADVAQREIHSIIKDAGFQRAIRHIVVAVSGPGRDPGLGGMQHFTYEPSENGYREVELFRGVHPMMGERLHLWRLKNFKIERLPSVEDVYLLHAVANDNPKDERLFAVAEVRDLTPVRDRNGRVVQLPHLERMFAETTAAIRSFQSKRPPNARLQWNRIFLYVWPTLDLKPDEVNDLVHKLARSTDGLGSGAGGGAGPHSQSANRRVAGHGDAHLGSGGCRSADDLPPRGQAATDEAPGGV